MASRSAYITSNSGRRPAAAASGRRRRRRRSASGDGRLPAEHLDQRVDQQHVGLAARVDHPGGGEHVELVGGPGQRRRGAPAWAARATARASSGSARRRLVGGVRPRRRRRVRIVPATGRATARRAASATVRADGDPGARRAGAGAGSPRSRLRQTLENISATMAPELPCAERMAAWTTAPRLPRLTVGDGAGDAGEGELEVRAGVGVGDREDVDARRARRRSRRSRRWPGAARRRRSPRRRTARRARPARRRGRRAARRSPYPRGRTGLPHRSRRDWSARPRFGYAVPVARYGLTQYAARGAALHVRRMGVNSSGCGMRRVRQGTWLRPQRALVEEEDQPALGPEHPARPRDRVRRAKRINACTSCIKAGKVTR